MVWRDQNANPYTVFYLKGRTGKPRLGLVMGSSNVAAFHPTEPPQRRLRWRKPQLSSGCLLWTDLHKIVSPSISCLCVPSTGSGCNIPEAVHPGAHHYGSVNQMPDLQRASDPNSLRVVQTGGDHATTLRAVRRAAENARLNARAQVRRVVR